MHPSLETLRELLGACGFDLWYQLARADDSYNEWIERSLALDPAARLDDATRAGNALRPLELALEGRHR